MGVRLSDRLMSVACMVERCKTVADIGCDHAHTSIYIIENNIADRCIAMDINKGPLVKAAENIKQYDCESSIQIRLSDGAKKLTPGEADCIIISGMGGRLICKIIDESIETIKECKQIIVQPQSEPAIVRSKLWKSGFYISDEKMVHEDGKYYVIIKALRAYDKKHDPSDDEMNLVYQMFGGCLLRKKDEVLKNYLDSEVEKCEFILKKLNDNINNVKDDDDKQINTKKRIKEIEDRQTLLRKGIKYYEM